jgi:hypothetical protein
VRGEEAGIRGYMANWGEVWRAARLPLVIRLVIFSGNHGRVSLVGFAMSNAHLGRKA